MSTPIAGVRRKVGDIIAFKVIGGYDIGEIIEVTEDGYIMKKVETQKKDDTYSVSIMPINEEEAKVGRIRGFALGKKVLYKRSPKDEPRLGTITSIILREDNDRLRYDVQIDGDKTIKGVDESLLRYELEYKPTIGDIVGYYTTSYTTGIGKVERIDRNGIEISKVKTVKRTIDEDGSKEGDIYVNMSTPIELDEYEDVKGFALGDSVLYQPVSGLTPPRKATITGISVGKYNLDPMYNIKFDDTSSPLMNVSLRTLSPVDSAVPASEFGGGYRKSRQSRQSKKSKRSKKSKKSNRFTRK